MNGTPFGPDQHEGRLGVVVGGSLTEGVDVRLDAGRSTEDVKVGTFVGIQGDRSRFLGVVTDVSLEATDPTLRANPPDMSDPYVASVVSGTAAYGIIKVEPMLVLVPHELEPEKRIQPAKTVPGQIASVAAELENNVVAAVQVPEDLFHRVVPGVLIHEREPAEPR